MSVSQPPLNAVGQPLSRVHGRLKVTGAADYSAEWSVPGLTHGVVVGSTIASGTIRDLDTAAAAAAAGVLLIVTHRNAARLQPLPDKLGAVQLRGEGGMSEMLLPLQDNKIYYAGQAVAVVVAGSPEEARYAASLVRVTYDELAPELTAATATHTSLPAEFVGNPEETLQVTIGDPSAALAAAPVRIEREYESPVHHHNPMELLATTANWETRDGADFLTLHDTSRYVKGEQEVLAQALGLSTEQVHVICHFIGGAFGSKGWTFTNPLLVALAARVLQRPLKVEWSRAQMFTTAGHRAATRQTFAVGASREGQITAIQHDTRTHSSMVSGFTEPCARMTRMMYAVPNIGFSHELTHLNLPSPCTMRAPGELVGSWAMECTLDELATELNLDPVELRLRNYAERHPETGLPWSDKRLRECYTLGRERFGWSDRNPEPRSMREGDTLIGYGMASTMYTASQFAASARATISADGRGLVESATQEIGNGAYTIFTQIGADGMGLPVERVRFELGDSLLPPAPATGSSSTTTSVGTAVLEASQGAIKALKRVAAADAKSPLFGIAEEDIAASGGRLSVSADPDRGEDYGTILRRAGLPGVTASSAAKSGAERKEFAFYSFGSVFAEVRVDASTGVVRVARLCGVYAPGRVINPQTTRSQLLGGLIMCLGATLLEETLFDARTGRVLNGSLGEYLVPGCADTPEVQIELVDTPDPHIGELGARGLGEMGCVGTAAAITNAIFHATGQRMRSLPITSEKVMAGL